MRQLDTLFRISITFLLGSLMVAITFGYFLYQRDVLKKDLITKTEIKENAINGQISTLKRFVNHNYKTHKFFLYPTSKNKEIRKDLYTTHLIKELQFLSRNMIGLGNKFEHPEKKKIIAKNIKSIVTAWNNLYPITEQEILDSPTISLNKDQIQQVKNISSSTLFEVSKSIKLFHIDLQNYWRIGSKLHEINIQKVLKELNKIQEKMLIVIILIFVGQIGIFLVTGYLDLSIIRTDKNHPRYRYRLITCIFAMVFSASAFAIDQGLIHLSNIESKENSFLDIDNSHERILRYSHLGTREIEKHIMYIYDDLLKTDRNNFIENYKKTGGLELPLSQFQKVISWSSDAIISTFFEISAHLEGNLDVYGPNIMRSPFVNTSIKIKPLVGKEITDPKTSSLNFLSKHGGTLTRKLSQYNYGGGYILNKIYKQNNLIFSKKKNITLYKNLIAVGLCFSALLQAFALFIMFIFLKDLISTRHNKPSAQKNN